ncbi:MAG: methionine ABC transporter ATP-binding protein [Lachnospiraceae bacterium]|nr:methionine ABC transporter ATP-binding protein [Lachnospiraceae bacterium]
MTEIFTQVPAIEVRHLSKTFTAGDASSETTVEALKDINLRVEHGDIYGVIGMSGAGKSTLVRCLNFLEVPTEGTVLVEGQDLATLSEKELRGMRANIAMIFQHFNLLMQKSVLDNVCFPLILKKVKKEEARQKARELLKIVGLEDKERSYPSQLSGGQKQRVAIARALASNPRILLCDEATSALDPQTTDSILNLLKKINREMGITMVIITHQMSVISDICNKVAIVERGVLVEDGLVEEIFKHPKSKAAQELILRDIPAASEQVTRSLSGSDCIRLRVVFAQSIASDPVIANMILKFQCPVSILKAEIKTVGDSAKGEMIIAIPRDRHLQADIETYLISQGLNVKEVKE